MKKVFLIVALGAMAGLGFSDGPEEGPHGPGQAIADKVREVAAADLAFVPGGVLQDAKDKAPLVDFVIEKGEKIVVVKLTGKQIQAALERSVSMVPSANPSFLQVSGLSVTYRRSSITDRLVSVETDSGKLDLGTTYSVAMPQTMAKGGFGYFTIWGSGAELTILPTTLGAALEGMAFQTVTPRYVGID